MKNLFLFIFNFPIFFVLAGECFAQNVDNKDSNSKNSNATKYFVEQNLDAPQKTPNDSISNDNESKSELSIFGIIKEVVEDKNIVKKFENEEDKIFLNKDIFDENRKEDLRKIKAAPKKDPIINFKLSQKIVSDFSQTRNFGNYRNNFHDTAGVVRYYPSFNFNKNVEVSGIFRLARFDNENDIAKRQRDPRNAGSRTFENMGIGVSELNLKLKKNNNSLILGKYTANFGMAWRWNKGIFIHNLPSNYNLNEKIGVAYVTKYGDVKKTGIYNLTISAFTNDRKNFDNSLFHRRMSESKSQAIAGDTRSLSSFAIATDINFNFSDKEKLSYHLAYSSLAVNKRATSVEPNKIARQNGAVFGINYEFPVNNNLNIESIIEYASIKNINGNSDLASRYLTTNVVLKYKQYSLLLGNSTNRNAQNSSRASSHKISEVNLGYKFAKNKFFDKLTAQIGYYQTIDDLIISKQKNRALALLVRYYKDF